MSVGLLVGFIAVCQVGCVGHEPPAGRIPSSSPAVIRTQAARLAPPVLVPSPDSIQAFRAVTALAVGPEDVPDSMELERWIQRLGQRGITVVLVEIGTGTEAGSARTVSDPGRPATGIYFRSQWATTIRDIFGELIPPAHRHGLSVVAVVSPRRMSWVDPALGWRDRSYDPAHHQVRPSPYLDLFHPGFQEYLIGLLTDLADTGLDGILFRNDVSMGPYDGFSPYGIRFFERDFQTRLDPAHLFPNTLSAGHGGAANDRALQPYPPEFWRWAGWKARERIRVLDRLGRAIRLRRTTVQSALEVHPEAITDPRAALIRYGEDLLEAKRRFQYFVLRSAASSVTAGVDETPTPVVVEQIRGLVGSAERIWITMPVTETPVGRPEASVPSDRAVFGKDIGLIYQSK